MPGPSRTEEMTGRVKYFPRFYTTKSSLLLGFASLLDFNEILVSIPDILNWAVKISTAILLINLVLFIRILGRNKKKYFFYKSLF